MECKCGCGSQVKRGRKFVDKEHQLDWMVSGGARELNALLPLEARQAGGRTAGHLLAEDGRLAEHGLLGAERAREISEAHRARRQKDGER